MPASRITPPPDNSGPLQIGILVIAVLAFTYFAFGFCLMFASGHQLLFGFDDFPLGQILLGFALGVLLAISGVLAVYKSLRRERLLTPLIITLTAVILSTISVPAARLMTRIVEEPRYSQPTPNP